MNKLPDYIRTPVIKTKDQKNGYPICIPVVFSALNFKTANFYYFHYNLLF